MTDAVALFAKGLVTTAALLVVSCAIGHALAIPVAIACRRSVAARAYVYVLRGTPLLAQLYLVYFGLPQLGVIRHTPLWVVFGSPFGCAVIAFALNTSAYTAAILDHAIRATRATEIDAARATGMGEALLLRRIVLPSAMRRALPAYWNELIQILHATAIAGAVTVTDLTAAARQVGVRTYAVIESYLAVAALYAAITLALTLARRAAERRWGRHLASSA